MAQAPLRLRVSVRRHGLPEDRFVLPVSLDAEPTVARLLELVNELFPIESGEWGLEDYAVDLVPPDGQGEPYECLHFMPIQGLMRDNDQIIVRPLLTNDLRRRRLSGRHQLTREGKHLIDGVSFGRPSPRPSPNRPPVHIAPRKRRKLLHGHAHRHDEQEDPDSLAQEDDEPMLLLTEGSHDADEGDPSRDSYSMDVGELERGDDDEAYPEDEAGFAVGTEFTPAQDTQRPTSPKTNVALPKQGRHKSKVTWSSEDAGTTSNVTDGIAALGQAFPDAPRAVREHIFTASGGQPDQAYRSLAAGFPPRLSEAAFMARGSSGRQKAPDGSSTKTTEPAQRQAKNVKPPAKNKMLPIAPHPVPGGEDDQFSESEDAETVPDHIKKYDHQGLPPGSISIGPRHPGIGSGSFAGSRFSGDSETTSATMANSEFGLGTHKIFADVDVDADANETDQPKGSASKLTKATEDSSSSSEDDTSSSESESESESDSSDDSGPEEMTSREIADTQARDTGPKMAESDTSSSGSDSESDSDTSSESSESSSDSDESSDSDSGPSSHSLSQSKDIRPDERPSASEKRPPHKAAQAANAPSVAPGAGKEATRKRNARRRTAEKYKKLKLAEASNVSMTGANNDAVGPKNTVNDEQAAFEAKRQALLNAIANGGVEIGERLGEKKPEQSAEDAIVATTPSDVGRGNEDEVPPLSGPLDEPKNAASAPGSQHSEKAPTRNRFDVGAGRRLLFGALGLKNPKSKEDADKIRAKLMKDVKPLANARLDQPQDDRSATDVQPSTDISDDWKLKISYRAVECQDEDVELSEPPFPFVQRWDPQQQNSWFHGKPNKRGGQGKRSQRNQDHFYQEEESSKKKRKHDNDEDVEPYHDAPKTAEDYANDIELNYDDEPHSSSKILDAQEPPAEMSQFTDMDDLPSLPKDVSSLPSLAPAEIKVGMVVTWKKWSCSPATGWQPQISDVTAVVVRVEEDGATLEVCLAKRDRELDGITKQYDPVSGQRVYGKFEAPDLDEGEPDDVEDEDEGYRSLAFADMTEPRIVQQPLGRGDDQAASKPEDEPTNSAPQHDASIGETRVSPVHVQGDVSHELPEKQAEVLEMGENPAALATGQGQQASDVPASTFSSQISTPTRQLQESSLQFITHFTDSSASQNNSDKEAEPDVGDLDPVAFRACASSGGLGSRSQSPAKPYAPASINSGVIDTTQQSLAAVPRGKTPLSGRQPDVPLGLSDPRTTSLRTTNSDSHSCDFSPILGESLYPRHGDEETPMDQDGQETPTASRPMMAKVKASPPASPSGSIPSSPCSIESIGAVFKSMRSSIGSINGPRKTESEARQTPDPKDLSYEEAMRKLDQDSLNEEPVDEQEHSEVPDSFPTDEVGAAQRMSKTEKGGIPEQPPALRTAKSGSISPPPTRTQQSRKRKSSPFAIPPNSQVIELLSSSDHEPEEPIFTEQYADEDADGTYEPVVSSGLPRGPGWVQKRAGTRRSTRSAGSSHAFVDATSTRVSESFPPMTQSPSRRSRRRTGAPAFSHPRSISPPPSTAPASLSGAQSKRGSRKASARF